MLGEGGNMRRTLPLGQPAAHAHEHGHVGHADDRLGDTGLRGEGIHGDHRVGVDILDDRHIGAEHQRLDSASKDPDTAALADTVGHRQCVLTQRALVSGNIFLHIVFLSS